MARAATAKNWTEALRRADQARSQGRLDDAEAECLAILKADPKHGAALHLLALVRHQQGRIREAIAYAAQACELTPTVAVYRANLGEMWRLAGDPKQALAHGERAIALDPGYAEAHSNVGIAHYELKDYAKSAELHRRAIAIKPEFAAGHSNLGNALYGQRRFDEAVASYRQATALRPDFAEAWSNLGTALHHAGRYDEAVTVLRRAIALDPQSANARSGLGILLLMRGDFAEGWQEYEWRLKSTEVRAPYVPQHPWQGEPLRGRTVYVHSEQGFGDTIQFARYLPMLAARGAKVTFRVQQGLAGLMRQSLPGVEVLGDRGAPQQTADYESALLSLPYLFGTRLETIPGTTPYLRADPAEAAKWRRRLALPGLKVGLAWGGNPEHTNDARRSIGLGPLAPLLASRGVSWVSLQVGPRVAELAKRKEGDILDISEDLVGFAATAAAIEALDLVISVDSAVAHLAGSLGKPVWLMTPYVSDWRWLLGRDDTPWYPTLRQFRQKPGQTWAPMVKIATAELAKVLKGDARALTPFREVGEQRARDAAAIIDAAEHRLAAPPPKRAVSAPQLLALAEQRRRDGKLAEADSYLRRVVEDEPGNAEAHHLRGIIAHQSGALGHAIEHLGRAAQLTPDNALFHANLGEMLRQAGRNDEAMAECDKALAINPDYADVLSNRGILLYDEGEFDRALADYDRAVALKPGFVQAHSNRGNALRALKRLDEAVVAYRRALELAPNFAQALNNLGTTLRDLHRLPESIDAYRDALKLKADDPEIMNSLALALKDNGAGDEAVAMLRRSMAIEPRNPRTLLYLGTMLIEKRQSEEAAPLIEQALAMAPDDPDIVNARGRIAFDSDEPDAALAYYRRALAMKPDLADALNNMGNALKELGRVDEAQEAFVASLKLDPRATGVYANFADGHRFTKGDRYLKAMTDLAKTPEAMTPTDRIQLDYALAKAYADLKDYKKSFTHLGRGAAAKRAEVDYDEPLSLGLFDRLQSVFTPELFASKAGLGDPTAKPVIIVGMPRSGTTLTEQVLASHPAVVGAGELKDINRLMGTFAPPDGKPVPFPDYAPLLHKAWFREVARRYLATLNRIGPTALRVTDKMPSNYYFVGLIHLAFPDATIIHTVRDPIDTCVSCFTKLFSGEQSHTYDLAELGRYYRQYEQLMAHWHAVLPPGRILDVVYEDMVADFEPQARRLVAHAGLPWDDRCLAFHETERPVRTASALQVRQPIYNRSVGRWRAYADHLGPLLEALNVQA